MFCKKGKSRTHTHTHPHIKQLNLENKYKKVFFLWFMVEFNVKFTTNSCGCAKSLMNKQCCIHFWNIVTSLKIIVIYEWVLGGGEINDILVWNKSTGNPTTNALFRVTNVADTIAIQFIP